MLTMPASVSDRLILREPVAPVWFLRLLWPSGFALYPEREVLLDSVKIPASMWRLESAVGWAASPEHGVLPGWRVVLQLPASQVLPFHNFAQRIARDGIVGRAAELLLALPEPSEEAPVVATEDIISIARLVVAEASVVDSKLELVFRELAHVRADTPAARPFLPSLDAPFPYALLPTARVPWIFGHVPNIPLLPYRFGPIGRLAADLQAGGTLAILDDVATFPQSGTLQIGDELLAYSVTAPELNWIGAPSQPLTRATPAFHRRGDVVYHVPPGGFSWLVAGHSCTLSGHPFTDANPLPPTSYTLAERTVDGRTHTFVDAPKLVVEESGTAGPSTIRLNAANGVAWSVGPFNTAERPLDALDDDDLSTFSNLSAIRRYLDLQAPVAPELTQSYGRVLDARIVVHLAATRAWLAASKVLVHVVAGDRSRTFEIPHPAPEQSFTDVADVALPIPMRRYSFDVSAEFGELFDIFQQPHRIGVYFQPAATDAALLQVASLYYDIGVDRPPRFVPQPNLRANVQGWRGAGETVLERPAALAHMLLTHADALGLPETAVDTDNLDALDDDDIARDRRVARYGNTIDSWSAIIGELLRDAGLDLVDTGATWRLIARQDHPDMVAHTGVIDLDQLLPEVNDSQTHIPNAAPARDTDWRSISGAARMRAFFGRRWGGSGYSATAASLVGPAVAIETIPETRLVSEWLPPGATTAAHRLAQFVADAALHPRRQDRHRTLWSAPAFGWLGDDVMLGRGDGSRLAARIASIAFASVQPPEYSFVPWRDGVAHWQSGNHALIMMGHAGLAFVVDHRAVLHVQPDGAMRLAGRVIENATLAETTQELEWNSSEGMLLISAPGSGADFVAVAGLTSTGGLYVAGRMTTGNGPMGYETPPIHTGVGTIKLCAPSGAVLLRFTTSPLRADLAGPLREALAP